VGAIGNLLCGNKDHRRTVSITHNTDAVEFNDNTVTGPVTITGNGGTLQKPDTGTVEADGNAITGPVNVQHQLQRNVTGRAESPGVRSSFAD
jgi:hypothetical protein